MSKPLRVLFVEDLEDDAQLVLHEIRHGGFDPVYERVESREALNAALDQKTWDIVISDYTMPNCRGTEALELVKHKGPDIPFIFVSGTIGEDIAVTAMKNGASDYVIKGNLARLVPAIERELKEAKIRQERRNAEEMVRHLAYHDLLTGLPNRTLFYDRLQRLISDSKAENRSFAILIMNLDRFKEINNTLGHQNGDIILQQLGIRLQDIMHEAHTIARVEGDKFAILLPDTDADGANHSADKVIKGLEKPFHIEDLSLDVSVSIGISLFPGHGEDAGTLIRRADIAMHEAKKADAGFCVYSAQRDQYSPQRLALMSELRHALEGDQLFLLYQPKIDLKTNQIAGVEAFVRWQHPKLGVIPPNQFIDLGEKTGLIKQLTFWVLKEALRQSRSWHQAGIEISVAVNLSVRNLQSTLLNQIKGLLSTWGVIPGALRLEITESTIMADPERAMEITKYLTGIGVRFSIDDFGTGYSSLSYLRRLPVDEIKIDKSFVMNMMVDENSSLIVRSIIELGHNMGLKVTAEGVENKEIMDRLILLGCDAGQGYLFSHPIPAPDLILWLSKQGNGFEVRPDK